MVRLILRDKPRTNWFSQFYCLKKQLGLNIFETIKLFIKIKKDRDVVVQSIKDERTINYKLHSIYWKLKYNFIVDYTEIDYGIASLVDANHYILKIYNHCRGFKIYVSKN